MHILKKALVLTALLIISAGCEDRAWKEARGRHSLEAYLEYLEKYPDGKHVEEANKWIIGFHLGKAKKKHTIQAYEELLHRYPHDLDLRKAVAVELRQLVELEVQHLTREQIENKLAVIETEFGTIEFEFFPDVAPNHCRNFMKLARLHFYDNLSFHQIIPDRLILGGAPGDNILGGPGYTIKAEINDRPHMRGTVAMYHGGHPDSAGSQFYICLKPLPNFDGNYTVFGQVTEGMEVVDTIAQVPTRGPAVYRPEQRITLKKVYIRDRE